MTDGYSLVDYLIGARLRDRRKALGLSLCAVADGLQITFQQLQRYEAGKTRLSAAKLYAIAVALNVDPAYFYLDLPPAQRNGSDDFERAYGTLIAGMKNVRVHRALSALVETIARPDTATAFGLVPEMRPGKAWPHCEN